MNTLQQSHQRELPEWMKWALSILVLAIWFALWIGGVLWAFSALHWLGGPVGWVIAVVIAVVVAIVMGVIALILLIAMFDDGDWGAA